MASGMGPGEVRKPSHDLLASDQSGPLRGLRRDHSSVWSQQHRSDSNQLGRLSQRTTIGEHDSSYILPGATHLLFSSLLDCLSRNGNDPFWPGTNVSRAVSAARNGDGSLIPVWQ